MHISHDVFFKKIYVALCNLYLCNNLTTKDSYCKITVELTGDSNIRDKQTKILYYISSINLHKPTKPNILL